jgi:hypothetical protein
MCCREVAVKAKQADAGRPLYDPFHSMTLFETESQYREKATIWRMMSLLPFYATLADGHRWRWFAVNIPMDPGTGGEFTSDIDILARLHDHWAKKWFYRAWEVKVSLICRDGSCRSLKGGPKRPAQTASQLRTYRHFGCPNVSLLEAYICEAGYFSSNRFPPDDMIQPVTAKISALKDERFGYQLLPFEHDKDGDDDVGLRCITGPDELLSRGPAFQTTLPLLRAVTNEPHDPFSRWSSCLNDFFEKHNGEPHQQIIFCRACHSLQLICMKKGDYLCPECEANLIVQS